MDENKIKIVQINANAGIASTGKICTSISKLLDDEGIENYILYSLVGDNRSNSIRYANPIIRRLQSLYEKVTGNFGFGAFFTTKKLIKYLELINPTIIHLHNIHSHDCDLAVLFRYICMKEIRVIWTFHDCWAFTGLCTHFDQVKCNRWETECYDCPIKSKYVIRDASKRLYRRKKESYGDNVNLTIVTPSKWLASFVGRSFLNVYDTIVINNGIDLTIFQYRDSSFKIRNNLQGKFIVLGVSNIWGKGKGLDAFIELSKKLVDCFQIVLVGTDNDVDKILPSNIISIHRTQNQIELAEIYSASDVFVNPTLEDNFPTVNMEAIACGTPVITYNTGGSPEIIDNTCGIVVPKGNVDHLLTAIVSVQTKMIVFNSESCRKRALLYDERDKYRDYLDLYMQTEKK